MKTQNHALTLVVAFGLWLGLVLGCSLPENNQNNQNSRPRQRAPNTTTYQNSSSSFTGKLAENYVDFCFDYPNSWKMDPKAGKGDSEAFVKVEKATGEGFTIENFTVAWLSALRDDLPHLAAQFSEQLSPRFPEYKKVSEGKVRIGPYDGYEFRFTSFSLRKIWGREVLLPGNGERKGAVLIMLTTSDSPDIHGPEDVGEKGELPIILNSFRFGRCSNE